MRSHTHTANGHVARKQRQDDARMRESLRADTITPDMQIALLDNRLGAGVGAVRERARLTGTQPTTGKVSRQKRAKQKARS
jgi:hypothetical protein